METKKPRYGMAIDLEKCMGCHTCSISCKMQNNVPDGMLWNRVLTEGGGDNIDRAGGEYPHLEMNYRPVACMHCDNAPCIKVCPVGATYMDDNGRVLIDYDKCIGCRYCMAACPYKVRTFNWQEPERMTGFNYGDAEVPVRPKGVVEKCTFCKERTDQGLEPACVESCPSEARVFGDLNDPDSLVSKLIKSRTSERLLEHLGTEPKVHYLR
ncbi:4Fe-4S dicluster domain-containing protein [Bacillaceae bacterium S4-13-58]